MKSSRKNLTTELQRQVQIRVLEGPVTDDDLKEYLFKVGKSITGLEMNDAEFFGATNLLWDQKLIRRTYVGGKIGWKPWLDGEEDVHPRQSGYHPDNKTDRGISDFTLWAKNGKRNKNEVIKALLSRGKFATIDSIVPIIQEVCPSITGEQVLKSIAHSISFELMKSYGLYRLCREYLNQGLSYENIVRKCGNELYSKVRVDEALEYLKSNNIN